MPLVADGRKRTTIRAGSQFQVGSAELVSGREAIPINITQVVTKRFGELADEDAQLDGFETAAELKRVLRRLYPSLQSGDPVTIVHFDPINNS